MNVLGHLSNRTSGCKDPPVHHQDLLAQASHNYICASEFEYFHWTENIGYQPARPCKQFFLTHCGLEDFNEILDEYFSR